MFQILAKKYPCRFGFIQNLSNLVARPDECFPGAIFVYGHAGTGKTAVVKDFLRLNKKNKNYRSAYVNCVECYTPKILLENALDELIDASESDSDSKRCDTLKEFVENLRNINNDADVGYVIVFDNADRLRDMDGNLLPSLLRLQELTGLNICVLLVSQIPFEKYHSKAGLCEVITLHCPQYSKAETLRILSDQFETARKMIKCKLQQLYDETSATCVNNVELTKTFALVEQITPEFFNNYLNVFLSVFYKACRDVPELKITACNCFMTYMEPVLNGRIEITDVSRLWRNIAAPLRSALSQVYMRFDKSEKNVSYIIPSKNSMIQQ